MAFASVTAFITGTAAAAEALAVLTAETGAGMGLAVASMLAEGMGGTLRLDSVEGEGTTVELWLPRA